MIDIRIDELSTENTILFSSIFKSFKLLPLETKEHCMIGQIDELRIINDTIYVLDRHIAKALYVFNGNGKFIRKIGKIGKGPGEYISPSSFTIDEMNNQIQILDRNKILIFSINGNFRKELTFPHAHSPRFIESLHGTTYIDNDVNQFRNSSFLLSAIDSTGKTLNQWLPCELYVHGFKQPMGTTNHIYKSEGDIKFMQPFLDTIFSVRNNAVTPFMAFSTKNKITAEDIDEMNKIINPMELSNYYWKCRKFLGIRDYIESRDMIMFRFQNNGATHSLFYYPKDDLLKCTRFQVEDDITKTTGYRRFYSNYANYYVSSVENSGGKLTQLIKHVKDGHIKISKDEISNIEKLTINSNPIIVLYECREEYKQQ